MTILEFKFATYQFARNDLQHPNRATKNTVTNSKLKQNRNGPEYGREEAGIVIYPKQRVIGDGVGTAAATGSVGG